METAEPGAPASSGSRNGGNGRAASSDRVTLKGLRVYGRHGVRAEERALGQPFLVDAELELDCTGAALSDELAHTVDYADLAGRLAAVVAGDPLNLLEALAGRLVDECLVHPAVRAATVTVHKPEAPLPYPFEDVAVTIRRERP